MLLDGYRLSAEMLASTMAWGIYGAAKEWVRINPRPPVEDAVEDIVRLVGPMMRGSAEAPDLELA